MVSYIDMVYLNNAWITAKKTIQSVHTEAQRNRMNLLFLVTTCASSIKCKMM